MRSPDVDASIVSEEQDSSAAGDDDTKADDEGPDQSYLEERRNSFTESGVAVDCNIRHKADVEPSYYSRERIVFHLGRLLKEFPFFHDMELEIQAQLPSIVSYSFHPSHSVYFQEGDAGDQCYIVLTGSVDVWKQQTEHEGDPPSGSSANPHRRDSNPNRRESTAPSLPSRVPSTPEIVGSAALQRKCKSIAHMLANSGSGREYVSPSATACSSPARQLSVLTSDGSSPKGKKTVAPRQEKTAFLGIASALLQVPAKEHKSMPADGEDRQDAGDVDDSSPKSAPEVEVALAVPAVPEKKRTDAIKFMSQTSTMTEDSSSGTGDEDANGMHRHARRVATLGPGSLFGELALLHDQPRNATIICRSDCEVLQISSVDFNAVLKMHMRKQKSDKIDFFRLHVPGMADLPEKRIEDYSYLFKPCKFPKNHFFVRQGASSEGVVHFLVKGAVEFRMASMRDVPVFSGLPEVAQRRLGCLATGGLFGSLVPNRYEPFSVVVTTSQCDVYRLSAQDLRRLPDSLLRNLRDVLEHQSSWRINRCDSPAGSILGVVPKKMPCLHKDRGLKSRSRKMLPVDLRDAHAESLWDMAPGEIIALKGKLPRLLPGASGSKSAPQLPPSLESRPPSRVTSAQTTRPGSRMTSAMSRPSSMSKLVGPTPVAAIFEQL